MALLDTVQLWGGSYGLDVFWTPSRKPRCHPLTPILTVTEPGWYVINAADDGLRGGDSMFVDVFYPVYVPNNFTPDNDGLNDVFKAEGADLRGFAMRIFNRWGEVILKRTTRKCLGVEMWLVGHITRPMACTFGKCNSTKNQAPLLEGHVSLIR